MPSLAVVCLGGSLAAGILGCTIGIEQETPSQASPASEIQPQASSVSTFSASEATPDGLFLNTSATAEKKYAGQRVHQMQQIAATQSEAPSAGSVERQTVPTGTVPKGNLVSLNFSRVDLVEIVHVLAQHLKLTYVIDPDVKGTVTIHSAEPLKKEDLLPIFHQILRMNNAVAIKTGDLYRIVPIKKGKGLARPIAPGREDAYALQVVPVRFFPVGEMKNLLTPFVTPGGEILDYPRGNFLIIMDLPSNIQRLMEIKDLMDVSVFAGVRMEIYQPKVASADELAAEMTKIMQTYASSAAQAEGFAAQFLPIPRTNQLLVISHSEAAWTYVKRWLERIDVLTEGPGRRIYIYPVENGKATELADILNQVYDTSGTVPARKAPPTLRDLHGTLSQGTQGGTTPGTSAASPGLYAVTPAPAPSPAPARRSPTARRPAVPPTPPSSPAPTTEERIRIVADQATNSLIIFGTAQEYQNIKQVLKKLDLVPRQVLMEVLVAEVTLTDDLAFGIEYAIRRRGSAAGVNSALASKGALQGTLPSTFPTGLTSIITSGGQDFRAVINALMKDSKVKVLSHPAILAVDNRPARIQVGSEEPVATGTTTSQVGTAAQSTTIQFRNLGRILTIIPQVNSQGLVHLQVKVEVSERGDLVRIGRDDFFSFDTRDAETTAVVQDGDTLTIGGIITERKSRDRTGIPYLMDIPVLGRFFGVTTDKIERTELVILITPRVIRNRKEAITVTREFTEKLSTVKSELERLKKEREKPEPSPPISSSPAPKTELRKTSKQHMTLDNTPASVRKPSKEIIEKIKPVGNQVKSPARETNAAVVKKERAVSPQEVTQRAGTAAREGVWTVQVSAFSKGRTSRNLVKKLTDQGYDAYAVRATIQGRTWYRVRVGRLATRKQAKELRTTLVKKGEYRQAFITVQ